MGSKVSNIPFSARSLFLRTKKRCLGEKHFDKLNFFLAGIRDLIEYHIQKEQLVIESYKNISTAIVKIVFRRRMECHVMNTILQTFLLGCVGFLSFFFRVDNITDHIMVTLTVQLVVATIMSSIQAILPKTSYYKMIDCWLMFILSILAGLMAFHTFVQFQIKKNKDKLFLGHLLSSNSERSYSCCFFVFLNLNNLFDLQKWH
jgi:uncharacterized membrane protein